VRFKRGGAEGTPKGKTVGRCYPVLIVREADRVRSACSLFDTGRGLREKSWATRRTKIWEGGRFPRKNSGGEVEQRAAKTSKAENPAAWRTKQQAGK